MMDYTTTAEESCSLLSFRIRCPRSRKRAVRADREKRLIKLENERTKLWYIKHHEVVYVPLDPPIQRGFKRSFVLREEVACSAGAAFYQGILDKINTTLFQPDRFFLKKVRKNGKKKIPIPQYLLEPDTQRFLKLAFTEKEASLFYLSIPSNPRRRWSQEVWKFKEPWRFRLKIRPNFITEQRVEDTAVEQRLQQIRQIQADPKIFGRMENLKGRKVRFWGSRKWPRPYRSRTTTRQWLMELEKELLF